MERKGGEMERVLDSHLNRFPPSNLVGLAHFLSGSFIEEQPVGVRTGINREKEQSSLSLALTRPLLLSVCPSPLSTC